MRLVFPAFALFGVTLFAPASDDAPVRLAKDDSAFRALVPASGDGRLRGLADDPRTVFYDENSMPRVYQGVVGIPGFHPARENISAVAVERGGPEPFGNPNMEFPWNRSAGLTSGDNAASFKFMRLPPGGRITWWTERRYPYNSEQFTDVVVWRYPAGTEFGNVKLVLGPQGRRKCFEVELRRRDDKGWAPAVYRPVGTAEEYAALSTPERVLTLSDEGHTKVVFRRAAREQRLPPLEPAEVDALLARPFKPVTKPWTVDAAGVETAAPTTDAGYHIVPKGYAGAWLKVGREECMTCHSGCGTLHANEAQAGRDWYGFVRGSDGIFSLDATDPRLAPLLQRAR